MSLAQPFSIANTLHDTPSGPPEFSHKMRTDGGLDLEICCPAPPEPLWH